MFSSRKKNVNFGASKSWLDMWILTIHGQVIKFENSTTCTKVVSHIIAHLNKHIKVEVDRIHFLSPFKRVTTFETFCLSSYTPSPF